MMVVMVILWIGRRGNNRDFFSIAGLSLLINLFVLCVVCIVYVVVLRCFYECLK